MFWFYLSLSICPLILVDKKKYFYVFFTLLLFFSAFRYNVGSDYPEYLALFNNVLDQRNVPVESSFVLISSVLQYFGFNAQLVFVLYSFLTFYFLYKAVKLFDDDFFWVVFLLIFFIVFYFPSLSVMRQALSSSILFYSSVRYLIKNDCLFVFFFYSFLAVFFHHPAIFFVIAFPFCNFRITSHYLSLLSFLFFLFVLIVPQSMIVDIVVSSGFDYKEHLSKQISSPSAFYVIYTFVLLCLFWIGNLICDNRAKSHIHNFVSNAFFCLLMLRVISFKILIFSRLAIYFNLFLILYFYYSYFQNFNYRCKQIWIIAVFVIGLLNTVLISGKDTYYGNYVVNFSVKGEPLPYVIVK